MKTKFLIFFLFFSVFVFSQKWEESYGLAKEKALESDRALLLVFAGSDWCGPCIKLNKFVFQSSDFQEYAHENLILYKADFPKKKANQLAPEVTTVHNQLAEKFNPKGYFPLVLVLDKNEAILGSFGYENKTVDEYISLLNSVLK